MIVGGTTTAARVESSNKGGNILNETVAGGGNQCGGTNDSGSNDRGGMWNGNDNRCIVMVCLWESYGRSVFLRLSS